VYQGEVVVAVFAVKALFAAYDPRFQDPFRFVAFRASASRHGSDNLYIYHKRLCNGLR